MSIVTFVKYQGLGNDFILLDDRALQFQPSLIPHLCHRKFGIGADGVILVQPSQSAHIRMRIFNPDGTEAASCGNGLRCFVLYLRELGYMQELYRIEIGGKVVVARCVDGQVAVDMGAVKDLRLHLQTECGMVHYAHTGVPHVVQFVDHVSSVDLSTLAPPLRHHPLFAPQGANVNVAEVQQREAVHVRTYERGVEGETLACGTGAMAVAAVARKLYGWNKAVSVHFPGGTLLIDGNWMIGPAEKVFSGQM
ncbi:MAG: diaminopimelate epimerase [Chlamydiia bacterium]|nr:diaminopimelate epimerase [Chlamydiia bacterium]